VLATLDRDELERLHADALAHATDYELVRRAGRTPPEELVAVAEMTAAINDAPTDDLDIEDEVFPPERITAYEDAQLARGGAMFRVHARHRATGELAGQTVVVVEGERPAFAHQHDTSVVRGHRGHRLGVLLKTEMLRWLAEEQPQLECIDTWNAESNDHMIDVNRVLGYEVLGRALVWQRPL
jgi:GNAT superfamily N-acetyltransferase